MSCKYCKQTWVEVDGGEILAITCTNEYCFEYHTDVLDTNNCTNEICTHFEEENKEIIEK